MDKDTKSANKFKLEMTIPGVDPKNLPTDSFLIGTVLFVAIYFVLVVYYIVPNVKQTLTSYKRLQSAEKDRNSYQEQNAKINQVLANTDYNPENVQLVDQVLYTTNPYAEVLLAINDLSFQHDVDISGLEYSPGFVATPSARIVDTGDESYSISFIAYGSYRDITEFLIDLENQAPFNTLGAIKINNDLEENTASAQVEILAQYYSPQVSVNVDTNLPDITDEDRAALMALRQDFTLKDYGISAAPIDPNRSKIDLFALEDIGLTLAESEEIEVPEINYYIDPVTGEVYFFDTYEEPEDEGSNIEYYLPTEQTVAMPNIY